MLISNLIVRENDTKPNIETASRILDPRQPLDLSHRSDFNSSDPCSGNPGGDVDRLVKILGVDQEIAADLLARFSERTVGHEPFAVANYNAYRRRCWLQWRSIQVLSISVELIRELYGLLQQVLSLVLIQGLFVMNKQDIFHECALQVDQHLEAAIDHALDVEGHRPLLHHLLHARVFHYLCVDAIAMGSRLEYDK